MSTSVQRSGPMPGAALPAAVTPALAQSRVPERIDAPATFARILPSLIPSSDVVAAHELLASGPLRLAPDRIGPADANNGQLLLYRAVEPIRGVPTEVVLKKLSQGGAQEVFAYDFAAAMGLADLLPLTVWREADAAAAMERFDGRALADHRINGPGELQTAFEDMVRARAPHLAESEIVHRARIDRQLMQVYDYLLANGDRHQLNAMHSKATSELRLIDHGLMNRYPATEGGLVPTLRAAYMGGPQAAQEADGVHSIQLEPQVRELLRGVDRNAIRDSFGQMLDRIGGASSIGRHATAPDLGFLGEMMGRLDAAIEHGVIRFRMI